MTVSTFVQESRRGELATLIIDNALGRAEIALFGAHVLSFTPHHDNRQRLWLSPHADLSGKKPIRGGVPLCWPWFSNDHGREQGELPSHGFLRSQIWSLTDTEQKDETTTVTLTPDHTRSDGFDYSADVTLTVTVGRELEVALTTTNTGKEAFTFNAALHTYFNVDNIAETRLEGLTGKYKDKVSNWAEVETPSPYTFSRETDRIHLDKAEQTTLCMNAHQTLIRHYGHDSIVVWNPWGSAASISDMDAFGYKHMLCVETAITQGAVLQPLDSRTLKQIVA
ncbi:D-hexose-6-phosphate mutarotase [Alteromonas sediminis]|uniref:Putative glucose-6-phosphate 1-epimerase n=1 Tax=Alteromonas sediminis TaxID=2259342 RepID=A0A3N5Y406_9ALTE|nr:D-hexose-6-phosphate mutarotase [Alteromonas sediminis]RPJ68752.1 D-hexose-6-phosphate mutarotase [Alteromonas sediminis]